MVHKFKDGRMKVIHPPREESVVVDYRPRDAPTLALTLAPEELR